MKVVNDLIIVKQQVEELNVRLKALEQAKEQKEAKRDVMQIQPQDPPAPPPNPSSAPPPPPPNPPAIPPPPQSSSSAPSSLPTSSSNVATPSRSNTSIVQARSTGKRKRADGEKVSTDNLQRNAKKHENEKKESKEKEAKAVDADDDDSDDDEDSGWMRVPLSPPLIGNQAVCFEALIHAYDGLSDKSMFANRDTLCKALFCDIAVKDGKNDRVRLHRQIVAKDAKLSAHVLAAQQMIDEGKSKPEVSVPAVRERVRKPVVRSLQAQLNSAAEKSVEEKKEQAAVARSSVASSSSSVVASPPLTQFVDVASSSNAVVTAAVPVVAS